VLPEIIHQVARREQIERRQVLAARGVVVVAFAFFGNFQRYDARDVNERKVKGSVSIGVSG